MSSNFPDPVPGPKQSWLSWAKQYMDAVITYYQNSSSARIEGLKALYNSHNGTITEIDKKFLVERYGPKSATTFVDFKLGRNKIKVLLGEYLTIDFDALVRTINPESIKEKADFANMIRGAMSMKRTFQQIEARTGTKPLNGIEIPSENDPGLFIKLYPKTQNEVVMQVILDDLMKDNRIKLIGYETLTDIIITSECHARIAKDSQGMEYIEVINPMNMIFQESPNDAFCEKTPFRGHYELMYVKDILQQYTLTEEQKLRLKSEETNTADYTQNGWKIIGGLPAVPVYTLEWKTVTPRYTKVSTGKNGKEYKTEVDQEIYRRRNVSITNDINKGLYRIETQYQDDLWEGVRIGQQIYVNVQRKPYQIQTRNQMGKYRAESDYINLLFGTVDGIRISVQELTNGLSSVYNVIMFQIVKEIRKMKGKVFTYDESFRPRLKSMKSVLYDVDEHGILRFASAAEQNYAQADVDNALNLIKELDLGLSQSFNVLVGLKQDIEQTIDRITGINENREGLGKASQTATGATQNIEASRTITKDIFYIHNLFMQEILRKFLEKRKTNWAWIDSLKGQLLLGSVFSKFLKITKDITNDIYGVFLSDGKKEKEIRELIRPYFMQEINAGMLRSMDVVAFERSRNLTAGLAILENAWQQVQKVAQEQSAVKERIQAQKDQAAIQLSREDREDWQAHEVQIQSMKNQAQTQKIGAQGMINEAKLQNEREISESQTE